MTPYEMAKKYYPRLWDAARIDKLYEAGKLTGAEREDILNGGGKSESVASQI